MLTIKRSVVTMLSPYIKIAFVAVVAVVAAQDHGHGHHGHAFSSQSIVLHANHGHEAHHAPAHHETYHHQQQAQSEHHGHHEEHHVDYYAHPKYEYEYKVEDPHTGDQKYQHESRDGDTVHGVYSLHEADGTIRTVKYTADKHTGFNAEVHREGHATHVVPEHHYEHHH